MRPFDLTPLFRSSIGFDNLMRLMDAAMRSEEGGHTTYPPYNIEKLDENIYRLIMAVAGFSSEELSVTIQHNLLTVSGKSKGEEEKVQYIYKGIARRAFERRFQVADFIQVGDALLENGLLKITLIREIPEDFKPQSIAIQTRNPKALPSK
ncbi:Hsp20 family protein [Candidatus Nucleicultrix amoebiphila]|jgi:molecular chaperone IbpA|uniref:SHSP domain-containing protein n=1 Tax=Candidatus Nucleicultrix amoebiphila FS5 TaxID=1414854 RepID=A0A1W6N530_9PROT|nr:Hsp20 family protein [Candidatus Nucleicultrix amoebiphila]ARN84953.1 hypothetical protein GQ61_06265 [Candidatus Nucleicultrix amoebiphila FS5]